MFKILLRPNTFAYLYTISRYLSDGVTGFGSIFCQVSHLWFGYGFGKFSPKIQNFKLYFLFRIKTNLIGLGKKVLGTSDGSGSKFSDLDWVGSVFCSSVWVSHLWFECGKFPLKISIFFPLGQ